MADAEKDGENTDPKSYSEDEVKALVDAANKKGASESWGHFQGVADKQIAEAKNVGSAREAELTSTINSMKADHISSLPEEQRTAAMVEELYKDRQGAKSSSTAPDSKATVKESEALNGDYEKQMRETIGGHLKGMGLDPDKINWGEGKTGDESLKTFLASVVDQVKAGQSGDGDTKTKEDPDTKKSENNVDTSRGAGKSVDINQVSPLELVASQKWEPIRGMMEE